MSQTFKINILYIEDDKKLNEEYQRIFLRKCEELFVAYNGQEGYESYIKNKPDLIITDISMPIMNGIEMIKKIRENDSKTPIIITSAFNENEYLMEAINQGVTRYILKPFNRKLFKQVIDETINYVSLTKQKEYYKNITKEYYEIIDNNIITSRTDIDGIITYASKAFCEISGYSQEELIGSSHNIVSHPDMNRDVYKDIWETITKGKVWKGEIKNIKKDGSGYWLMSTISPICNAKKEIIAYTSIRVNISDKKRLEEISIKDSLTDIYNRRFFNQKIIEQLNISKRRNEFISLLIIDIDCFKLYNDTYGHQEGDAILIKVAKTINSFMKRANDFCFRIGGEEFAVLFNSENIENSIIFSNKIKEGVENLKIEHKNNTASKYVTISSGLYFDNANNIKNDIEFFKKADDLLYKAKEAGRNQVASNQNKE